MLDLFLIAQLQTTPQPTIPCIVLPSLQPGMPKSNEVKVRVAPQGRTFPELPPPVSAPTPSSEPPLPPFAYLRQVVPHWNLNDLLY
ncbi:MAG: hypothetical protein RBJ76_13605 [Stenomitos frigidus ULC029]